MCLMQGYLINDKSELVGKTNICKEVFLSTIIIIESLVYLNVCKILSEYSNARCRLENEHLTKFK